jgi:hypothetical protein
MTAVPVEPSHHSVGHVAVALDAGWRARTWRWRIQANLPEVHKAMLAARQDHRGAFAVSQSHEVRASGKSQRSGTRQPEGVGGAPRDGGDRDHHRRSLSFKEGEGLFVSFKEGQGLLVLLELLLR